MTQHIIKCMSLWPTWREQIIKWLLFYIMLQIITTICVGQCVIYLVWCGCYCFICNGKTALYSTVYYCKQRRCREGCLKEFHYGLLYKKLLEIKFAEYFHDDVITWKHFPRYWPFVRGNLRSPVNSPHKDQWRGALVLSFICTKTHGWVNIRDAGDLRRHRAHCDVYITLEAAFIDPTQVISAIGWDPDDQRGHPASSL